MLEPLEGRVLLSADFVGAVDLLNQPILPHEAPAVSTLLDNGGPRAAHGPALFTTLHPHDAVIGPSFAGWHFDDRPGDAPKHHDHDGAQPTFTLTGPGKSEVVRDGDRWDVVLTGTDSRSIFTVTTHGADAKIDDIRVDGSLGQLRAGDADLYGDLSVRGTLHRLVLDDVKGGTVSAESVDEVRIKGDLRDATFLIGADLGADGQLGGSGAAADEFGTGHVELFKVDGDVDDTTVRVGIDPVDGQFDNGNDKILGRAGNGIDKVEIGDSLSHDSLFQAGVLPHAVKVDHHRVDPSHDHRFITWTRGEHHLSLEAELAHDTGASATDGVTSDPTIKGTLEHSSAIRSFKAGFDDTSLRDYVSIKGELGADGQFTLSRADLARINEELCGRPLDDGTHTLHLIATDAKGHTVRADVTFTLDTRAPRRPTLDLAAASDSAPVGDHRTTFDVVTLVGKTSPGALVALLGTGAATTADQHGRFTFEDVSLDVGKNVFTVKATDLAGNKSFGSVRITRLAAPAAPTLAIGDATVTEGNAGTTNAVFNVVFSAASTQATTVNFATADGTATAGSDYTATSGTLTFAPGTTSRQITVPVLGDTLVEPTEAFSVNLSAPTNATLADGQGLGTITNDDAAATPTLTIGDATVAEGNAGTTNLLFTVTLSAASVQPVTVDFATSNGTALAPGDYATRTGTLTFAPGVTTQQITVPVVGDLVFETNENFLVNLTNVVNATIADGQGVGTITNDDNAPTLAINDVTVTEGNAGTTNAVFTVSLT
ncbi:MAG TPA: Calx-beta domain-containing protein, partial [Methylomirabilota bacterium]|nr:Calx-beta domain-containing protein [Methylomirabilota bacterium]